MSSQTVHLLAAPTRAGRTFCGCDTAHRRVIYVIHARALVTCPKCRAAVRAAAAGTDETGGDDQ